MRGDICDRTLVRRLTEDVDAIVHFAAETNFRYSLSISKIKRLGWSPKTKLHEGLERTVEWYKANEWWWRPLVK